MRYNLFIFSIFVCLLFSACGNEITNIASSVLKYNINSNSFMSKYTCKDVYPEYSYYINKKDYNQALQFVCKTYNLKCSDYRIHININNMRGYASTHLWTNIITLNYKAFHYPYCFTDNQAYDGWLAAIIAHEMVHVNQNWRERFNAIILNDKRIDALLELEAWEYMWQNADKFRLTTRMKIEIDTTIDEYQEILNSY